VHEYFALEMRVSAFLPYNNMVEAHFRNFIVKLFRACDVGTDYWKNILGGLTGGTGFD